MSIRLTFFISKNRIDIKRLCAQFDINTYEELKQFCASKRIKCDISQKEFDEVHEKNKVVKNETTKNTLPEKPKPKTGRRGRKPKAKKDGNADQKSST
tara:strand:+ start:933 stop:1226 length:294 start_codon:yes stop_codon:yes gene_type:complete